MKKMALHVTAACPVSDNFEFEDVFRAWLVRDPARQLGNGAAVRIHDVLSEIAAKSKCPPMKLAKRTKFDRVVDIAGACETPRIFLVATETIGSGYPDLEALGVEQIGAQPMGAA